MVTNPNLEDTDIDGTLDGDEDRDLDGVFDSQEFQLGLNPFRADTDGDGWYDEAELTAGSDARNPNSRPSFALLARPTTTVLRPSTELPGGQTIGAVVTRPELTLLSPSTTLPVGQTPGAVIALPPISYNSTTNAP